MIQRLHSSSNLKVIPEYLISKPFISSSYESEDYWDCKISALVMNIRGFRKLLKMLDSDMVKFLCEQEKHTKLINFPFVLELWKHFEGGMKDCRLMNGTIVNTFMNKFNELSLEKEYKARIDNELAKKELQINNEKALLIDKIKELENILYKEVPLLLKGVSNNKVIEVSDRGGIYDDIYETATTPAWDFYNYKYRVKEEE